MHALIVRSAFALSLLAGCATACAASSAPFLWRVHGRLATHYLIGSVHLLPAAADTLPDGLEDAYAQTDGAVFETDIGALSSRAIQLQMLAAARSKKGLEREVGARQYASVRARARSLGMPMTLCDAYRAWFCAINLGIYAFHHAGFSEEYGIDGHFYGEAVADDKAVSWLESPADHIALFTGVSAAESHALLRAALRPDPRGLDSPEAIYRAWRSDDTAAVAAMDVRFKARYPALYERLIAARNRAWMPRLRTLLNGDSPILIVVGAAHLVGPDGLVVLLRSRGFHVERGLPSATPEQRAGRASPLRVANLRS